MKRLACLVLTGFGITVAAPSLAAEHATRAVIELFTSQGCSSCPPADALIGKLADDPSILALSFPVDYWDYLGWKDTFARPEFSNRERDYATARGDRDVYTPQAVVDGRAHEVGSDAEGIEHAIAASGGTLPIAVSVEMAADSVVAHIGGAVTTSQSRATVWLVKYGRKETVAIGRGENSGRTVTYTNVVKEMQPVGLWKGQAMTVELPRDVISAAKNNGFALLLQTDVKGKPGPILGATILSDGNAS